MPRWLAWSVRTIPGGHTSPILGGAVLPLRLEWVRQCHCARLLLGVIAPLQNKLGALLTDPRLRAVLDTGKPTLDLHATLREGQALLVNLSKGRMGEGPSSLLGALLTVHLTLCGLARSAEPERARRPFFLYLDEFPSFATPLLATALSELRKYRVGLTLAHQYFSQLDPLVRDAALGNAGTLISFRVGAPDAPLLAREFAPVFDVPDLLSLPNYHVYTRLMISGQVSRPFSFSTYRELERVMNLGS